MADGQSEGAQMGPMANPRRPRPMEGLIDDAVKAARTESPLAVRAAANRGFFWQPSACSRTCPRLARIYMNEEPFGPIRRGAPHLVHRRGHRAPPNRLPLRALPPYAFYAHPPQPASAGRRRRRPAMLGINNMMISISPKGRSGGRQGTAAMAARAARRPAGPISTSSCSAKADRRGTSQIGISGFSEEQRMLRDSVRTLMDRHAPTDMVGASDRERIYPYNLHKAWADGGAVALPFAEANGGARRLGSSTWQSFRRGDRLYERGLLHGLCRRRCSAA